MSSPSRAASGAVAPSGLPRSLVVLFAFCCGAIVANIYYAQPIIALIAPDIGLSGHGASLIVSLTQLGYALGLFLLVPLGDLLESRRLLIGTGLLATLSLAAVALCRQPAWFLLACFVVGFSSVTVQILIPLAAHMAPEPSRGRVVGSIMSGLLLGVLLARPAGSLIADGFGWRGVFAAAAVLMALILVLLATTIPRHRPAHSAGYGALLLSLFGLLRREPVLRRRTGYQAMMFATFSLFWTAVPLELARRHGLSQTQIALFALVGAVGAAAAPLAGRLADAGRTRSATRAALLLGALSYLPSLWDGRFAVLALCLTGVLLDCCVQTNMVLGQRAIYALDPASRSRLNALYMTGIFLGGALGSALASVLYEQGGWAWTVVAGSAVPLLALAGFLRVEGRG
jgi:predicted MFS family arabinose efflux permease